MRRFFLWLLPAGAALVLAVVFATGFAGALSGRLGKPVDESPAAGSPQPWAKRSGTFRIVVLGDSVARGAGDTGRGGVGGRVADAVRKDGAEVELVNLAVDGSETKDLVARLREPSTTGAAGGADLVLVSIGGNDLTHSFRGLAGGVPGAAGEVAARTRQNLVSALQALRAANASAPIRLLGLYNPFPGSEAERRLARDVLLRFNVALEEAALSVPAVLVIPTADLFEERLDRLAADRFHPGPTGYDEIASRVVASLPKPGAAG